MEDFNYIYVLDYSDGTICEIELQPKDRDKLIDDIVESYGCNINTCSWMATRYRVTNIITLTN